MSRLSFLRVGVALAWILFAIGHSFGQDADTTAKLRSRIAPAIQSPWQITDIESVNRDATPWKPFFSARKGYVITLENLNLLVPESAGKGGSSSAAMVHPLVQLWFLKRSITVTPNSVNKEISSPALQVLQSPQPKLLGFDSDWIVCSYSWRSGTAEVIQNVVSALKLIKFSE